MERVQTLLNLSPLFVLNLVCQFYPWKEKQLKQYEKLLSWKYISKNENMVWTEAIISQHSENLDFGYWGLSMNKSMFFNEKIIDKYYDKWDWMILTDNPNMPWSISLIEKYKEKWAWESYEFAGNIGLSSNRNLPWSEKLIDRYKNRWCWEELSSNPSLPWSLEFVRKYEKMWTWDAHYGYWGMSLNPSPLVKEIMKVYYPERIDYKYYDKETEVNDNVNKDDIIINAIMKVFSDNSSQFEYILSSLNSKINSITVNSIEAKDDEKSIQKHSGVSCRAIFDNNTDDNNEFSCVEFFDKEENLDWKLILASNILLFRDMGKYDKCNMLYGYAECLSDTLTAKLGFDKSEDSDYKYVETTENGIIDKRLEEYVAQKFRVIDKNFYQDLQKLDIIYIEKNIDNLEPLRFCKNLKVLVFDGYWIDKYKFRDFSPLKNLPNVYIWHNSGDSRIKNNFYQYTNIEEFKNIRYSEAANDPWDDFCEEISKYLNE